MGCEKELESRMTFGKYKGKTVAFVVKNNASYILWAAKNVPFFKPSERLMGIASSYAESQHLQYLADMAWGSTFDPDSVDDPMDEIARDIAWED